MSVKKTRLYKEIKAIFHDLSRFLRWIFFAGLTGLIVGFVSILFARGLTLSNAFRNAHPVIMLALPLAGLLIVFLYRVCGFKEDKGTNLVLATLHAKSEIPFRMMPLIFVSTILTHLFGGSAGREGAALQLGGSVGNQLGRWFHFDENDTRMIVMCGMSAAFSSIFGTPLAAVIFAMEVGSIGIMHYAAFVPCVTASLVASGFATAMEIRPEAFPITQPVSFHIRPVLIVLLLAVCCAFLSILFCKALHITGDFLRRYLKNPYVRVFAAGLVIVALTAIIQTDIYNGAGIPLIEKAFEGNAPATAFLWKIIFTAITLGAGFKGGEIVPSFCIGATFGCMFGNLFGLSPSLCAAVAMVAVFCGVTNCPITSLVIGFELFGFSSMKYLLIGVSVSYMLSGYTGLYAEQTIMYSKFHTKYINKKASR